MRFVERAVSRPNTCAVIPGRGAAEKEGFIDTGNELQGWDPHIYISMAGARAIAAFIGWASPEATDAQAAHAAELQARIEELERENDRLQDEADHVHGLMKHGYTPKRAAGRPLSKKAA